MALTKKQIRFCEEYLANGFNALKAYTAAYDKSEMDFKPSYPYRLLKDEKISAYIEERRNEIYNSLNIDALRIAQELSEMAFAEKGDAEYSANVKLRALEILSKNLGLQNQKIDTSKETIEVSLED